MDLRQYGRVFRAHWLLVASSVLICTGVAGLLAWTRTPVYEARSQLFVSTGGAPADLSETYVGGLYSQQRVLSYAEIVSSPEVVQAVIERLGLPDTVRQLQDAIDATVPSGTVLIDVAVRDPSPRRAKAIADAVGEEFSTFVQRLETPQNEQTSPVKVSVTSRAQLPTSPAAPNTPLYLVLGVMLGLVLGVGGAVLREVLDDRVKGEDDAAAITGAPVVGSIPEHRDADDRPLIVADDPLSVGAEAYRRLRTNLDVVGEPIEHEAPAFVVSSAVAAEGKTVVAANVGIAFAQAGYRVVLVDADLRRPKLADMLGIAPTVGLTNVLEDDVPVRAGLQTWRDDLPLEVLASGGRPPNPSELLASERFAAVVSALRARVDVVLIDAPALLPVADAAILARTTSGVILVTRVASTRTDHLESAARSLRAVGEPLLGVVLNRTRAVKGWPYQTGRPRYFERIFDGLERRREEAATVLAPSAPAAANGSPPTASTGRLVGIAAVRAVMREQPDRAWNARDVHSVLEERRWLSPTAQRPLRGTEAAINRLMKRGELIKISPGRYKLADQAPLEIEERRPTQRGDGVD
jgi:succinoglycan biosynthesis transport protein ExoP